MIDSTRTVKKLWQIAEEQLPKKDNDVYTQAIMDVGSLLCKKNESTLVVNVLLRMTA